MPDVGRSLGVISSKPVPSCDVVNMEEKSVSRKRTIDLISLDLIALGSPADPLNGFSEARKVDGSAKAQSNELVGDLDRSRLQKHKALESANDADDSSAQNQHLCQSCISINFRKILPGPKAWKRTALRLGTLGTLSQFTVDPEYVPQCHYLARKCLRFVPRHGHMGPSSYIPLGFANCYWKAMLTVYQMSPVPIICIHGKLGLCTQQ